MGEVRFESMVLQNDGLKHILEVLVGITVSSVDTAVLIVELNCTSNSLEM